MVLSEDILESAAVPDVADICIKEGAMYYPKSVQDQEVNASSLKLIDKGLRAFELKIVSGELTTDEFFKIIFRNSVIIKKS